MCLQLLQRQIWLPLLRPLALPLTSLLMTSPGSTRSVHCVTMISPSGPTRGNPSPSMSITSTECWTQRTLGCSLGWLLPIAVFVANADRRSANTRNMCARAGKRSTCRQQQQLVRRSRRQHSRLLYHLAQTLSLRRPLRLIHLSPPLLPAPP